MKNAVAAARQAQAVEKQADELAAIRKQLDAIEQKLDQLLQARAATPEQFDALKSKVAPKAK